MAMYDVTIPVTGYVFVTDVEASSEDEAIEVAMQLSFDPDMIEELQYHRQICSGNVCNAEVSEAYATKQE